MVSVRRKHRKRSCRIELGEVPTAQAYRDMVDGHPMPGRRLCVQREQKTIRERVKGVEVAEVGRGQVKLERRQSSDRKAFWVLFLPEEAGQLQGSEK